MKRERNLKTLDEIVDYDILGKVYVDLLCNGRCCETGAVDIIRRSVSCDDSSTA
jgi:hypothetical protein